MKRVFAVMAALLMAASFAGCNSGGDDTPAVEPDVSEIMDAVREEIAFPEMAEQTVEDLAVYGYDELSADDVEEVAYAIASSGLTAEEVMILKLRDAEKADAVKEMMTSRRDSIAATAQDYNPEQMGIINDAVIETRGSYCFFAITADNAKAKQIFEDAFQA